MSDPFVTGNVNTDISGSVCHQSWEEPVSLHFHKDFLP